MTQKFIKVGSSIAVTIPRKFFKDFGYKAGDKIEVVSNAQRRTFLVKPVTQLSKKAIKIADLTHSFIQRYRKDLEALAKK